jgi:ADP-ribose pyrophosphatase
MKIKKIYEKEIKISKFLILKKKIFNNIKKKKFIFFNFKSYDYVTIIAKTKKKKFPLVYQYRHSVEKYLFELPGGLIDKSLSPSKIAIQELKEETGLQSKKKPKLIAKIYPEVGRLENKLWIYYIDQCVLSDNWKKEETISVKYFSKKQLIDLIKSNKFLSSVHLSAVFIGMTKKFF